MNGIIFDLKSFRANQLDGISQEKFAKQVGISQDRVSRMEADPSQVTLEVLCKISAHFGIDRQLLEEVIQNKPKSMYEHLDELKEIEEDVVENFKEKMKKNKDITGLWFEETYTRNYPLNNVACNLIGFMSSDSQGTYGVEESYNDVLCGTTGREYGYFDSDMNLQRTIKEAKDGNSVVLTIDANVQQIIEQEIADFQQNGMGAERVSVMMMNPKNGEVLAMASYPGYQPDEYNKNYDALLKDESKPLFNRALNGAYTPGSTFKPLTSIAALESGTIEPNTKIYDAGKYMYYAPSYTPTCLIWRRTGETHGTINVSEAIGVSCNYFYYEVGRLMGIETINKYAYMFGLGEKTGIELSETTGIVAGPDYRDKLGLEWYPGDTLQAAIGQSDNMYTPAQLASYVATIINGGKRYGLHLVKEVRRYDNGETVMEKAPEVLSDNQIEQTTVDAVLDGMKRVTADGTAKAVFEDFPVAVGGKTGTAEVSRGSDNVLFVGFAPYENPQIAVAIVIEHGASSSFAASVGRDIFEYYLGLGSAVSNVQSYNSLIK